MIFLQKLAVVAFFVCISTLTMLSFSSLPNRPFTANKKSPLSVLAYGKALISVITYLGELTCRKSPFLI